MRISGVLALIAGVLCSMIARAECVPGKLDIPVTMRGLRPIMPIRLEGKEADILVDTGSFWSLLTPAAAARYQLKRTSSLPDGLIVSGVNGAADVSVVQVRNLGIGKSDVHNMDFLLGAGDIGGEATGLLGRNILRIFDLEFDLANGQMRFWRFKGCGKAVLAYWVKPNSVYSSIPIETSEERTAPIVTTVLINGHKIRAEFDTGADSSYLTLAGARKAGIRKTDPGVIDGGYSTGIARGRNHTWIAPVGSFEIGGEKVLRTKLRIGEGNLGDVDMLIGDDFFLSNRVMIAFSQNKIYFTYNGGRIFNLDPLGDEGTKHVNSHAVAVLSSEPTEADGFVRRGMGLMVRGDIDQALKDFTKAIELDPKSERAFYQRALARGHKEQHFLAMEDLNTAAKLKPDDPEILIERARFKLDGKDREGALADLRAASRAAPEQAGLRDDLGQLYGQADEHGDAVREISLWMKYHRADANYPLAQNARCWQRALGNFELDLALVDCDSALRGNKRDPGTLDSRGLVHLRRGEYDAAIADYDAALAKNGEMAWSLYGRGVAKLKKGLKTQGEADIDAAAKIAPKLPERARKLGIVA